MAEYGFNDLVDEIANDKKLFAEYTFGKKHVYNENTREIYLSACEKIANVYTPYGFKYSKSGQHLRFKQKSSEFIFQISFSSSRYNIPNENIAIGVCANVLSHGFKKWRTENKIELNVKNDIQINEYIAGGNIGNLRKEHKYLKWNIGKIETRENEIDDIIENINKLAIPFFHCFSDIDKLIQGIKNNSMNYYDIDADFFIYLTKVNVKEKNDLKIVIL
jgi:hypothetical protein